MKRKNWVNINLPCIAKPHYNESKGEAFSDILHPSIFILHSKNRLNDCDQPCNQSFTES